MLRIIFLTLFILAMFAACGRADASGFNREGELSFVRADTILATIDIEIADDIPQRTRGLMYRQSMDERHGMLFIFEQAEPRRFWMKHTAISLDILFADSAGVIVAIETYTTPFSKTGIPCNEDALYVVEVNAGYAAARGIRLGDRIEWARED
ncbi:MAG: DUF192 domain-containing protein [Candidatus Cloacimonetes bacterium]|nr:DUF192 domain-containing protein [Candidatus Cloacimonadota bacterium]